MVALSPGEDICYSSPEDYAAATGVFDQLRDIGITSFYVAFDDISGDFTCDSDTAQFTATGDKAALAQAQAYFLGRIQREYIKSKGLPDLWMAPTQYTGMDKTDYKTTLGKELDPAISVQWTGRGIVPDSIPTERPPRRLRPTVRASWSSGTTSPPMMGRTRPDCSWGRCRRAAPTWARRSPGSPPTR